MFSNPEKPDWMEKSYINLFFRDNVLDHFDLFLHKQKRRSKLIFTIISLRMTECYSQQITIMRPRQDLRFSTHAWKISGKNFSFSFFQF